MVQDRAEKCVEHFLPLCMGKIFLRDRGNFLSELCKIIPVLYDHVLA
jgi:hypothetical protein